jgi:hypothetical protein
LKREEIAAVLLILFFFFIGVYHVTPAGLSLLSRNSPGNMLPPPRM